MKKNKTIVLRESDVKKMKKDITHEVTRTAIFIFLAWLVETEYINGDADTLKAEYDRLEGWFEAIEQKLINVSDIRKIIEDQTECRIRVG